MCGRKTLTADMKSIIEYFAVEEWENPESYLPSYNIAPTQISPVLIDNGKRIVKPMRWGLIPAWAKDDKFASKIINARIETLQEKPSYRNLINKNRCVIIADGYYEWQQTNSGKIPYYIYHQNNAFIPMAGLYDIWKKKDNKLIVSYTIITKESQADMRAIHNRMPVILSNEHLNRWLKIEDDNMEIIQQLQNDISELQYHQVSRFVNSVKNNSEKCIQEII